MVTKQKVVKRHQTSGLRLCTTTRQGRVTHVTNDKETSGPDLSTGKCYGDAGSVDTSTDVTGEAKKRPKETSGPELSTAMCHNDIGPVDTSADFADKTNGWPKETSGPQLSTNSARQHS